MSFLLQGRAIRLRSGVVRRVYTMRLYRRRSDRGMSTRGRIGDRAEQTWGGLPGAGQRRRSTPLPERACRPAPLAGVVFVQGPAIGRELRLDEGAVALQSAGIVSVEPIADRVGGKNRGA